MKDIVAVWNTNLLFRGQCTYGIQYLHINDCVRPYDVQVKVASYNHVKN